MSSLLEEIARRRRASAARRFATIQRPPGSPTPRCAGPPSPPPASPPSPPPASPPASITAPAPTTADADGAADGSATATSGDSGRIVWRRAETSAPTIAAERPLSPAAPEPVAQRSWLPAPEATPAGLAQAQADAPQAPPADALQEPPAPSEPLATLYWGPVHVTTTRRQLALGRRRPPQPRILEPLAPEAPATVLGAVVSDLPPPADRGAAAPEPPPPADDGAPAARTAPAAPDAAPPGFLERGRLRRRERYLRQLREIQLRDLGGFMVELHRFGRQRPDLVAAKVQGAAAIDAELRAIQLALSHGGGVRELREAGIGGACAGCGSVHGSSDRYCSACGEPLDLEEPSGEEGRDGDDLLAARGPERHVGQP